MVKSVVRPLIVGSLAAIGLQALPAPLAQAAVTHLYVSEGGTDAGTCASSADPCGTVSYALTHAVDDTTIHVSGRIYDRPTTGSESGLTITGVGAASPAILDGSDGGTVFTNWGTDTELIGLRIEDGLAGDGGGVFNFGGLTIQDSTVADNVAVKSGGGVINWTGELTVIRSTISDNHADSGGGILTGFGPVTLIDSTLSGNTAEESGGGIDTYTDHPVSITRSTFSGNIAGGSGGAFAGEDVTVVDSTFTGNQALTRGSALFLRGSGEDVSSIVGTTIANNSLGFDGGALQVTKATAHVAGSIIANNTRGNCNTYLSGSIVSAGYNLTNDATDVACSATHATDRVGLTVGLGPLQDNGGTTKTRVPTGNGATRVIPEGTDLLGVIACHGQDQRGQLRPQPTRTSCTSGAVEPGTTVAVAPAITSGAAASVVSGATVDVGVTATGLPVPSLSATGLPAGVSFFDNGDGTGGLIGSTTAVGDHTITLTASNGIDPAARQPFTLHVDPPPSIAINDITVTEGDSGTKNATFTVTRTGVLHSSSSVRFATVDGTATAPSDYTTRALSILSFAPGQSTKSVAVTLKGDTTVEPDETFKLNLSAAIDATLGDASGTATILNDDTGVGVGDIAVPEGNSGTSNATFTLTRTGSTASTASVKVATTDGTATAGADYSALPPTTITFNAGQATRTVAVPVKGDTAIEADETLTLNLSDPVGTSIGDASATATLVNDDATQVSVADIVLIEGSSGATTASFTLARTGSTSGTVSVKVATANGTATAGGDYTALAATTVTFANGQASKTVTVSVTGDAAAENDETFKLNLSAPVGATISDSSGTATVVNDDAPVIWVNDIAVTEGNTGTTDATFTLTRSSGAGTASVKVATVTGTASAADFTELAPTTISFAAGETSKPVVVKVKGDTVNESNEAFQLYVYDAVGGSVVDFFGTATIIDNEAPLQAGPKTWVTVDDVAVAEGSAGSANAVVTITRYGNVTGASQVSVTTVDATATADDYTSLAPTTVAFAAGETTKSVPITVQGDTVPEDHEALFLALSAPTGATIAKDQGSVSILNDDVAFVGVPDVVVVEGNAGTKSVTFTLRRTGGIGGTSTVTVATANSSAAAGSDYVALAATAVSFVAGQATRTVTVTVKGDATPEPNETFKLNLTAPVGATISDASGTATIINDD